MSGAARLSDLCTGHGCWPSRPNVQGSPDVIVNGRPAHRQGDLWAVHCCPAIPECHSSSLAAGSPVVFTNGRQQGRINDPVACGSKVLTGSPNVFVGNGGFMPAPQDSVFIEQALLTDEPELDNGVVVYPRVGNPTQQDIRQSIANGFNPYGPAPVPTEGVVDAAPKDAIPVTCGELSSPFLDSTPLTANFTLGKVSTRCAISHYTVVAQHGLSEGEIVCNLKALAENVLEAVKRLYPGMFITSAFRAAQGRNESGNVSQHEKGQAADIQFTGAAGRDYYDIALKLKDALPYDQFILEYGGRNPWIHISHNSSGNRGVVLTRTTAGKYISGIHLL